MPLQGYPRPPARIHAPRHVRGGPAQREVGSSMKRLGPLVSAAVAVVLTLSLVIYPEEGLEAAREGMKLFFDIVFPSLLPFFILSELLLGLGVVHFIGVLFEPLMRPVFNVPGEGAFALSMGLAAGYPMDAVITAKFRRQGMCTRVEGERLLAFTNTADPLFIFGAVAVGMFGLPWLGAKLAIAHYIAAFLVGLIFRFYGLGSQEHPRREQRTEYGGLLRRAVGRLLAARREDGRPLGQLLGDAVTDSIKTLLMICGFIVLFSVFVRLLNVMHLEGLIATPLQGLFALLGLHRELVPALVAGLLEIDLGTLAASKVSAPLVQKALIASAIIAWSGLSVHGQVASVLTGTDIRMGPYAVARLLHAVLAAIFTVPFLKDAVAGGQPTIAVFGPLAPVPGFWLHLAHATIWALAVPLGVMAVGVAAAILTGGLRWAGFYHRRG